MKKSCPICASTSLELIWKQESVPVVLHKGYGSVTESQNCQRGHLEFVLCRECCFVFNSAFDSQLMKYDETYDNRQGFSPLFTSHMKVIAELILEARPVNETTVVEVGCGKGDFLKLLDSYGISCGIGYHASYEGNLHPAPNLEFRQRYLSSEERIDADIIFSRHVIEHIENPIPFLETIKNVLPKDKSIDVFFETPTVDWILENGAYWDFFYEHCSLFSPYSLAYALRGVSFVSQLGDTAAYLSGLINVNPYKQNKYITTSSPPPPPRRTPVQILSRVHLLT